MGFYCICFYIFGGPKSRKLVFICSCTFFTMSIYNIDIVNNQSNNWRKERTAHRYLSSLHRPRIFLAANTNQPKTKLCE